MGFLDRVDPDAAARLVDPARCDLQGFADAAFDGHGLTVRMHWPACLGAGYVQVAPDRWSVRISDNTTIVLAMRERDFGFAILGDAIDVTEEIGAAVPKRIAARALALREAELLRQERERQADPLRCELLPLSFGDAQKTVIAEWPKILGEAATMIAPSRYLVPWSETDGSFVIERSDWTSQSDAGRTTETRFAARTLDEESCLEDVELEIQLTISNRRAKLEEIDRARRKQELRAKLKPVFTVAPGDSPWRIVGQQPRAAFTLVLADEYGGKSILEYSKAIAIAGGVDWNGRAVEQGRVMLVLRDGTAGDDNFRRLRGIAAGMDLDLDDLIEREQLLFYNDELFLDERETVAAFLEVCDELDPPLAHAVFDNYGKLKRTATIGAGNDQGFSNLTMDLFAKLSARGVSSALLHHVNSKGESLGSNALPAASDVEYTLRWEHGPGPGKWITITGRHRRPCEAKLRVRFVGGVDEAGVADDSPIIVEEDRSERPTSKPTTKTQDDAGDALLSMLPLTAEGLYAAANKTLMNPKGKDKGKGWGRARTIQWRKNREAVGLIKLEGDQWVRVSS